jgi:hypothetical protein
MRCEGEEYNQLAQNWVQWWIFMKTVKYKSMKFLTSSVTISFSRYNLYCTME